jgi:hypothetical protein
MQEKELPKEKDATLWDCEELALRYILEDGKLNLYVSMARCCCSCGCCSDPTRRE